MKHSVTFIAWYNFILSFLFLQNEEWVQFQSDLLMTVRVANDFKTETQVAYENLVIDNKAQRDKIRNLEQEIIKLNKGKSFDCFYCLNNS